jgi:inner membrane protein
MLAVLLLVPLLMIQSTISERSRYRATVVADIARSYSNAQTLNGPVLVIPYRTGQWRTVSEKSGRKELEWTSQKLTVLPSKLQIGGNLAPDRRARGIYTVQVYTADLEVSGSFDIPRIEISPPAERLESGSRSGTRHIRYPRIRTSPTMDWGGKDYPFQPGSNVNALGRAFTCRSDALGRGPGGRSNSSSVSTAWMISASCRWGAIPRSA